MTSSLLSHRLSARAAQFPERTALAVGGGTTSYARIEELSDRLAATLSTAGIGHRDRIGIYLPKGLTAYVSLFATLKLGAVYVPLDPSAPPARIRVMVRDGGLSALIATTELAVGLLDERAVETLKLLVVEGEPPPPPAGLETLTWDRALETPAVVPANPAVEDDLAYVLYTSGSTGRPKGVMISHRGAQAFVEWAVDALALRPDDRVAAVAELHFDLSVFDLFATVAVGATLLPLPPGILLRPRQATAWIAAERISCWYSTPSTLILLLEEGEMAGHDYPHLRRILFAGEVFPTKYLRRLHRAVPGAELYNLYGPTETNVCTWKPVDELPVDDRETVPIGKACANTEVVALADDGRKAAVGEVGELWVRGPTVMCGYWGDPEKSAAALCPHPELGAGNDLWYGTGDLVHRDGEGEYHYHGRRDHMVKIRGYRIELGDVESALYTHPNVRELAVVAVPSARGAKLRAYIVPYHRDRHSPIQLKAYLGELLPAYMIPAEMECLESLPKTSTGKVDRQALMKAALGSEDPDLEAEKMRTTWISA